MSFLLTGAAVLCMASCSPKEKAFTFRVEIRPSVNGIEVKAACCGIIEQVLIDEGQTVEVNDPLFVVRPIIDSPIHSNPTRTEYQHKKGALQSDRADQDILARYHQAINRYNQAMTRKKQRLSENEHQLELLRSKREDLHREFAETGYNLSLERAPEAEESEQSNLTDGPVDVPDRTISEARLSVQRLDFEIEEIARQNEYFIADIILLKTVLQNKLVEFEDLMKIAHVPMRGLDVFHQLQSNRTDSSEKDARSIENISAHHTRISFVLATQSGYVTSLQAKWEDLYIKKDDRLCIIQPETGPLSLSLKVPVQYKDLIHPGMKIRYRFDAFPEDIELFGTIENRVDQTVTDDSTHSFVLFSGTLEGIYALKKEKRSQFRPGMQATAEVSVSYR